MTRVHPARACTLHDLIAQYGGLRLGRRGTAQARGREFNSLIASVLCWWGIDARVSVRGDGGRDEIDVVFAAGHTRFILEAKWLKGPVSAEVVAKLHDRIRSRAAGTRGVVLSISGYTKPVLQAASHNKWPEILLLDRTHFEAILCGLTDPAGLLAAALDHASYEGGSYATLTELLIVRQTPSPPAFIPVPPAKLPWPVVNSTAAGVAARVLAAGSEGWPEITGMARGRANTLLLTTPDGVVEVDPRSGATTWALALTECRGTPAIRPDGSVMAVCGHAAVNWGNRTLTVAGGGFSGQASLLHGPGDTIWVLDFSGQACLTRLNAGPGDQEPHQIAFPAHVQSAAWLDAQRFYLAADGHSAVVDLDLSRTVDRQAWIETPHPEPLGVMATSATTVITAGRAGTGVRGVLYRTDLANRDAELIADLSVNATGNLVATGEGQAFLVADVRGNNLQPHPILIHLTGLPA
jgi:Restriction endonuclease